MKMKLTFTVLAAVVVLAMFSMVTYLPEDSSYLKQKPDMETLDTEIRADDGEPVKASGKEMEEIAAPEKPAPSSEPTDIDGDDSVQGMSAQSEAAREETVVEPQREAEVGDKKISEEESVRIAREYLHSAYRARGALKTSEALIIQRDGKDVWKLGLSGDRDYEIYIDAANGQIISADIKW
jgi:uncharacterized membrane protein YkoI